LPVLRGKTAEALQAPDEKTQRRGDCGSQHKTLEPKEWKKVQLEAKPLLPTASISTAEVD